MGLINKAINNLPFELHIPSYRFCGPGTKLKQRLAQGQVGINPLDDACRKHDIAYSQHREDLSKRHEADRELTEAAWKRVLDRQASLSERAAAWAVANTMKAKVKLGLGLRRRLHRKCKKKQGAGRRRRRVVGRGASFKSLVSKARGAIKRSKARTADDAIKTALNAVHGFAARKSRTPKVIPMTKKGGVLPLIPIFAGLSALGALTGGAASVAKAVKDAQNAKKELKETKRHNSAMEAIAIGKGMFIKPYKKGFGLFLKPPKN